MRSGFHTVSTRSLSKFAKEVFESLNKMPPVKRARLVILSGNLGSGKTTFTQNLAKFFGIRAHVLSPTFVFVHEYKASSASPFSKIIHVDAYRMETKRDVIAAGVNGYLRDPKNLILIEWGERIKRWLPKEDLMIEFRHHKPRLRKIRVIKTNR